MALPVPPRPPVAPWPCVLGVVRRLEVATVIDRLLPPHPAHQLSGGRGVEARGRAILDGPHARAQVGQRLDERGLVTLLQSGRTRAALKASRLGPSLEALWAATLPQGESAVALTALAGEASATPWWPQDTTPLALSGADADAPTPPGAPRPASGQSQDGRAARQPGRRRRGGSGAGGGPGRLGRRAGHRRARGEPPVAMAAGLAGGGAGGRGLVAARKAERRRPVGGWLAQGRGVLPCVPRPGAVRQARAAWGQQPPVVPRFVEPPGRTQDEGPRRGHGHRGLRRGAGEESAGRGAQEARRGVVGQSRQRAPPHAQASTAAQAKEAAAVTAPVQPGPARWGAWEADAAAAIAADAGRGPGRRGRPPRRPRRGRPATTAPPPSASGERLGGEVEALSHREEAHGWTVLATTGRSEACPAADLVQADPAHQTPVAPGLRWSQPPAAIAPGWLEPPARLAALARLTVRGLLGDRVLQRQVRLSLRAHDQQSPGTNGLTATPTAAVGVAWLAQVAWSQCGGAAQPVEQR